MKRIITYLFFSFAGLTTWAQVGIGTPLPNPSSQLEVVASDRGILIPRLPLTSSTDATTITNGNVTSLLVYNTATAADVLPGYHYWDGAKWVRLAIADDIVGETVTTLVNNGDGTYTYTSEDNTITVIDITGNETITNLVDNGNGTITYTNESGIDQTIDIAAMIDAFETLTTLVDNGDGTMTYTDEDGNATIIDISNLETLTSLVGNGDGTMTYTDEDGNATIIDISNLETLTTLVNNGDGTYTYTSEDGTVTIIDIPGNETLTTLVDNGDGTMTYTDEDGNATIIDISNLETLTSLVDNGDGTMTYTDEDGNATIIDISNLETLTTLVNNGDGTYTYTSEDGTVTTIDVVGDVINNATTIFNNTNVLNEIINIIQANETLTSLVDNGDGTITYTDEDGVATVIDIAAIVAASSDSLVDNGDGTFTHTAVDGTVTIIDIPGNETLTTLVDNGDGTMTYTDEDGVATVIDIANLETLTSLVDNGDGTMTYTDEDGNATIIDISNLETLTTLVNNGDGTYTYTSEDGTVTTIDVVADVINNATTIFNDTNVINEIINIIQANETLTSLVDNGDGTITYTDEDGVATVIDISAIVAASSDSLVDNGDGTFTHTAVDGTVTIIDIPGNETLTTLVNNGDGTYTYTSEDGTVTTVDIPADVVNQFEDIVNSGPVTINGNTYTTLEEYLEQIVTANETVTTLVDNGDGTYTYTSEDGTVTSVNTTALEPWFGMDDDAAATDNTEDIYTLGRVAIGQNAMFGIPANEMLAVNGSIRTATSVYADYVFEEYLDGFSTIKTDYSFKTLEEVDNYIKANKHLPGVTSIQDLMRTQEGEYSFNLSELSVQMLEKVEELYLHTIEQQKQLKQKDAELQQLKDRLQKLEALVGKLVDNK